MASAPGALRAARRSRERDIVAATRALFDERGLQDAPIEDIARAVGINKALIYRHFASKEELFVLTVTRYLGEIDARLAAVEDEVADPRERLRRGMEAFAEYGIAHPAFLDCALSLLRQPAGELRDQMSDAVWVRLGLAMAAPIGRLSRTLEALAVDDPDFVANQLYLQAIGVLHLARSGVGVREPAQAFPVEPERVRDACVAAALAYASPSSSSS
jgi:AcrR family transcriptional regulator